MKRGTIGTIVAFVLCVAAAGWWVARTRSLPEKPVVVHGKEFTEADRIRKELFYEVQPIALANCELKRFGEANDGGYLLCANLLGDVKAGYSYGISGYDGWGCQISTDLRVKVHQYDCFDLTKPACSTGAMMPRLRTATSCTTSLRRILMLPGSTRSRPKRILGTQR